MQYWHKAAASRGTVALVYIYWSARCRTLCDLRLEYICYTNSYSISREGSSLLTRWLWKVNYILLQIQCQMNLVNVNVKWCKYLRLMVFTFDRHWVRVGEYMVTMFASRWRHECADFKNTCLRYENTYSKYKICRVSKGLVKSAHFSRHLVSSKCFALIKYHSFNAIQNCIHVHCYWYIYE